MMKPGTYTVVVTPFKSDFKLDEEGLRENIRFQMESGVEGVVVLGTTGEAPTLNTEEKRTIIQIAREVVPKQKLLIVGTGSYSTEKTIEETRCAIDLGADIALVVTPYYNKPTQEGLYRHFEALTKAVTFPILIYNIQGRTATNLQTETLKRLSDIPEIIGVKESSGNIVQMMDVIEEIGKKRSDFIIFSGDDNLTFPLLCLGGQGVLSVISNLIPKEVCHLVKAALSGDFLSARKLHFELLPLFKAVFLETNPIPIKAMMNCFGMKAGPCRLPLCELTKENKLRIDELINSFKVEVYG